MGTWLRGVVPAALGFCLYRSASTHFYNSGMGMHGTSVGFVSDLAFVLAMNVCFCLCSLMLLALARKAAVPRWLASPWVATAIMALGALEGWAAIALGVGSSVGVQISAALFCGVGLMMLSIAWVDFFISEADPAKAFAQVVLGYSLYTLLSCINPLVSTEAATLLSLAALALSAALYGRLRPKGTDALERSGHYPPAGSYRELPVYVCFFVLVGVVGLMHTSVLGSASESMIAVPMWVTRVISLMVFLFIVVLVGQGLNPGLVFRWVFPILIVVLTLLPFLGAPLNSLTGLVSITCYTVCGMVFYLFNVREARRLGLSSALVTAVYMLGSSGTLLVGLLVGLALQALSASFDISLLTMLAFVAIYPLALVLIPLLRRGRQASEAEAAPDAGDTKPVAPLDTGEDDLPDALAPSFEVSPRAVAAVADGYGLTRREREVLGYLAAGRSVKYIAETLVISENTAWTHTKRIYAKTETHGKQELMDLVEKAPER